MTSEITILAGQGVNQKVAEKNNIKVTEVDGTTLLQTHAVVDSGADTNCTDSSLRECLGTDKLPDAARGLQGATGRTNNVSTNKLRMVTMDNEVTVMEARSISDLGYSGPSSDIFLSCVKRELEINNKNEDHLDFALKGITPRVLIGLKNGNLLGMQLSEQEMVDLAGDTQTLAFPQPTNMEDTSKCQATDNRLVGDRSPFGGGKHKLPKIQTPGKGRGNRGRNIGKDKRGAERFGEYLECKLLAHRAGSPANALSPYIRGSFQS